MTNRRSSPLPDITDDDFRRRLDPLARAVLPGSGAPQASEQHGRPISTRASEPQPASHAIPPEAGEGRGVIPDSRITDDPEFEVAGGNLAGRKSSAQEPSSPLAERIAAVTHIEEVRTVRGPKRGVEFLLPERVVSALKVAAAKDGTSMSVKVLEALRDAGYPITTADFVDLRKLPKR
jgi:hypothetical protein